MKINKKIIIGFLAFFFVLAPLLIFAQAKSAKACEVITQIYSRIEQRLTQRETQLNEKIVEIGNKYAEKNQQRETILGQRREKWDENRQEQFAKLQEKAQTDSQKQAVIAFVKTITQAVKDRRAAFDKAISDFQKGLQAINKSRVGTLSKAVTDYKSSVKEAFDKADQSCESGIAIKTIRNNLREDLQGVRSQYQADIKKFQGNGAEIQKLVEAKKEAMNKAKDEFKVILDQALAILKAAMPGDDLKQACLDSGGQIAIVSCCKSAGNYPNTCLIGACGCSLESSKEIKTCDCGEGKCFNGTACVVVQ